MRKKHHEEGVLIYQKHQLKPQDTINFIEMEGWAKDCKRMELNDHDQKILRVCIMSAPEMTPIIRGTGGLRKGRFAPGRWNVGKSGGVRVCYVYFKAYSIVLLVKAYGKNEKANLTPTEKKTFKKAIKSILKRLRNGPLT